MSKENISEEESAALSAALRCSTMEVFFDVGRTENRNCDSSVSGLSFLAVFGNWSSFQFFCFIVFYRSRLLLKYIDLEGMGFIKLHFMPTVLC